jgi:hypothetical protein
VVHQQAGAGVQRGLGQLDRAHVTLFDVDARLAVVQQVSEGALAGLDPRTPGGRCRVERAVRQDDAGKVQAGNRFDDARAANARDALLAQLRGEARVVRPALAADDAETRLQVPDRCARAGRGAGRRDLRLRAGRAGGGARSRLPSTISALKATS